MRRVILIPHDYRRSSQPVHGVADCGKQPHYFAISSPATGNHPTNKINTKRMSRVSQGDRRSKINATRRPGPVGDRRCKINIEQMSRARRRHDRCSRRDRSAPLRCQVRGGSGVRDLGISFLLEQQRIT
ncbi:hypothetical protein Ais01nite_51530 [Asanoa ishikariensis]|nr:hypothetical protein Ais01nite_51530 [Asanoa ishikariensis]